MTSLASGALLNAAVGPFSGKGGDERSLLRNLQETFDSNCFYPRSPAGPVVLWIVSTDRGCRIAI